MEQFEPIEVLTQVVAGVNFFIKIKINPTTYIHTRVFRSLSDTLELVKMLKKNGLTESTELYKKKKY